MLDFLFYIIIYPIQLVLEIVFSVLYTSIFKGNIGIALAGLSFAVSFLCLPMYAKADKIQQIERSIEKKLAPKIASIKKCFSGDERYFTLSMYYRENNYHPLYSLRSSLSLIIQIPFFIAAYSFISKLDIIIGKSFLFLTDLSKPDNLFVFSGLTINILPILMTVINLSAAIIYGDNLLKKEKVQLYLTPFVFLVLLYNTPSALVLYWTMNNIFSLFKVIILKTKSPLKILYILGSLLSLFFTVYVVFIRFNEPSRALRNKLFAVLIFSFIILLPWIIKGFYFLSRKIRNFFNKSKFTTRIFIISLISIWLLVGFFVPANIIASDPSQFTEIKNMEKPLVLLFFTLTQAAGLFILYPYIIFTMLKKKLKILVSLFFAALSIFCFANYFIFQANYGIISQTLTFSLISGQYLSNGVIFQIINILFFVFAFFII